MFPNGSINERNHYCERGRLKAIEHALTKCYLRPVERDLLRKCSTALDFRILFDIKKDLGALAKFLDSLPQLLF